MSANHIQGGTLTLGGQNNQNGVLRILNANGDEIGHWNNNGIAINSGSINLTKTEGNKEGSVKIQQTLTGQIEIRYSDETSARLMTFGGINPINIIDSNSNDQMVITERGIFLNTTGGTIFSVYQSGGEKWFIYNGDHFNINADVHLYQPLGVDSGGTGANTAAGARTNLGITPANIGAVAKSGDAMTGKLTFNQVQNAIAYTGTKATYDMIKFIDNTSDEYGNGISIGGGGATIIGGGESANVATEQVTGGDEVLYLCNDGDVNVFTNMQNGWSDRKTFTFGSNGTLTAPAFSGPLTGNVTGNCSGSSGSCASNNLTNIAFDWSGSYTTGSWMLIYNGETGANGGALYRGINRANTAAWVDSEHKWARISGDTFTGIVHTSGAGERYFAATNTDTGCRVYLDSDAKSTGGVHGIFSNGYWDGSAFVSSGKWMIVRKQGGDVAVNGTAENVTGTVLIAHGGTGASTAAGARANLGVPEIVAASSQGLQASLRFTGADGHSYGLGIFGKGQSYKIGLYDNTSNEWAWRI